MDKDKLKKILTKADKLQKGKEMALASEFISIDEKIDEKIGQIEKGISNINVSLDKKIADISEELKKKLDEELLYEVDEEKIAENILSKVPIPKDGEDGKDGKDYILTEKDKKEIASSIKVPIVEKVIEKTEVIKEQPIITNEIKEVAIADTGEEIVLKINDIESLDDDYKIDAKHIKNLKQIVAISETGGNSGQTYIGTPNAIAVYDSGGKLSESGYLFEKSNGVTLNGTTYIENIPFAKFDAINSKFDIGSIDTVGDPYEVCIWGFGGSSKICLVDTDVYIGEDGMSCGIIVQDEISSKAGIFTTDNTSAQVIPNTATTVSAFLASTNTTMGAATGKTNIRHNLELGLSFYLEESEDADVGNIYKKDYTGNYKRFLTTLGQGNIFLGFDSGNFDLTGTYNLAVGPGAGQALDIGEENLLFGYAAGSYVEYGSRNLYFGSTTGGTNVSGTDNICIGRFAGQLMSEGDSYVLYLGDDGFGTPFIFADLLNYYAGPFNAYATYTWDVPGDINASTAYYLNGTLLKDSTETLTNKRITQRVTTITSSATPTINTNNCDAVTITALATNITSMTTNLSGTPTNFQKLLIRIKDNGTARAITWGASFIPMGSALPTTTVVSKILLVEFVYDTVTSKWGCVQVNNEV